MKRNCDGCRALAGARPHPPFCSLRYQTASVVHGGVVVGARPLEECPKPQTWRQLWDAEMKPKETAENSC